MTVNEVYILGAGFSCHAGLPLVRNLLQEVLDYVRRVSLERTSRGAFNYEAIPNYQKYMELKHPEVSQGHAEIGIEELMMEMSGEIDTGNDVIGNIDVVRAFELLRYGTVDYINSLIDEAASLDKIESFLAGHQDCVLISFNWDTLVERAALALGLRCVTNEDGIIRIMNPKGEVVFLLLKLHGSVQWIEKTRPRGNEIRPHHESLFTLILGSVYAYNGYDSVDFITPLGDIPAIVVPSKDIRASLLNPIWAEAERVLSRTSEIVAIGYSLPPYDQPSIDLLSRWTESDNSSGHDRLRILTVVDPSIEVHQRYKAIFEPLGTRVTSVVSRFELSEWATAN